MAPRHKPETDRAADSAPKVQYLPPVPGTGAGQVWLVGMGARDVVLPQSGCISIPWFAVTTGGENCNHLVSVLANRSGSVTPVKSSIGIVRSVAAVPNTETQLATIQSAFGLSISGLASVLKVERPTIYSWMRSSAVPSSSNAERLAQVATLAEYALSLQLALRSQDLSAAVPGGGTLMDLLRAQHLRTHATETALRSIAAQRQAGSRSRLRDFARSKSIETPAEEFDALTGRRFADE